MKKEISFTDEELYLFALAVAKSVCDLDLNIMPQIDVRTYKQRRYKEFESLKNEIKLYRNQKTLTSKGEGLKKAKKVFETFKNNYEKQRNEI